MCFSFSVFFFYIYIQKEAERSKDLHSTMQALRREKAKTSVLNNRLKELAADTNQANTQINSLTAQLQKATGRISDFEKLFADVEDQLKDSQVMQIQKDKEIQVR